MAVDIETEVLQGDLEEFLKSAQMLQIDGLTFGEELLNEEISDDKQEDVEPTLDSKETTTEAELKSPQELRPSD